MMRAVATRLGLSVSAFLPLFPLVALAAGMPDKIVTCGGIDCTVCDIAATAQNVLNTGIFVAVFLSAVLFAWAGFLYLTNAANQENIGRARGMFTNVIVGLLIILSAWLIIDTLMKVLVGNGSLGPWNKIC